MNRASAVRLALLALLWGSSFLFIKVALEGLSPMQIVLARMVFGALVLLVIVAIRHDRLPRERRMWAHIAVASVIANLIPYFLFGWGEQHVDSSVAGALNATTPLFTLAIAFATRTESTITRERVLSFLLGFAGAVLIVAPWNSTGNSTSGALACLAAALSYAVSYVYMRRYLTGRGTSPIALAASQISVGALILLVTAPALANQAVDLQLDVVASVLALGALGTGLAYLLNYRLIQDEGATAASTVTYLLPIVAVGLGWLALDEPAHWNLVLGTAIVLAGVASAQRNPERVNASVEQKLNAPHSGAGMRPLKPDWSETDAPQQAVLDEFVREMQGSWVWLYRQQGAISGHSVGHYSALLTTERAKAATSDPGWDVHIGGGGYGFTQYSHRGEWKTVYERYPGDGVELLVQVRSWHSVRPGDLELVEEFRLLFNLWEDRATRTFYEFDESGNPVKAAVVTDEGVRVLSSLVRRYQAAKQMYLALYFDSTRWADDLPAGEHIWDHDDDETVLAYYRGDVGISDRPFSRLFGKRLLAPPPIAACGIAPYEREQQFEEFIIAVGDLGEEIRFSSDPDRLANYFGANPGNPHYLTPVYFRRDVLSKYYADPDRYSVTDGRIQCAGLWSLRIDNDRAGHVMVFLGDLGRDIPQAEAVYFRSFNIAPPEEGPSDTLIRRAFRAEFADPESVDLRFPHAYREANTAWKAAFGTPLFKPLHTDDQHVLNKLHVPMTDGAAEFDEQVLYLAKLLVDSLDEEAISARIAQPKKGEKGLAKLERFLDEQGMSDARALLKPFADVQGLRSRSAAHRKGSTFDIGVAIGELNRKEGFEQLLLAAMQTLTALSEFAAAKPSGN